MKRYEREIAELLEKMDDFVPEKAPRRKKRPPKSRIQQWIRFVLSLPFFSSTSIMTITPTSLIVASIILALMGYLLRDLYRPAAPWASMVSVLLLLSALLVSVTRRRRRNQQRWRGRVIEFESYRSASFLSRLHYYWHRILKSLWQNPRDRN
jgi:hypothetical protein